MLLSLCQNGAAVCHGTAFGTVVLDRSTARIFFENRSAISKKPRFSSKDLVYLRPLGLSFDRWRRSTNRVACWIGDRGQADF